MIKLVRNTDKFCEELASETANEIRTKKKGNF